MNRSPRCFAAAVALSLCLVHCSSSGPGGPDGGGHEASTEASSPADGAFADSPGNDSSSADASGDDSADSATCPSVAQACADGGAAEAFGGCGTTWATAQQLSTWCPKVRYARVTTAPHCNGFDILSLGFTDTATFYYYDLQTGALVGVWALGGNAESTCVAGSVPNVPLTDCYDGGGVTTASCGADASFSD